MSTTADLFRTEELDKQFKAAYSQTLSLWKVPFESIYVETEYGNTHVLVCGPVEGEPLILLNGFGFSATMWYPNVEALSRSYRVYAVDVIGEFNRSEASKDFRAKTDYVNWLAQLLDKLGIEQAYFAGHSNGGWHILNFAMHAQSRIKKMILLAPAASFASFSLQFPIRLMAANIIKTRSVIIGFCAKWFTAKPDAVSELLFEQFYRGIIGFGWKHKILIPSVFSDEELSRIKVPLLLAIGDQEVIYNVKKVFARAVKVMPHIETAIVKGAGHALSIEKADDINSMMLRFLNNSN